MQKQGKNYLLAAVPLLPYSIIKNPLIVCSQQRLLSQMWLI